MGGGGDGKRAGDHNQAAARQSWPQDSGACLSLAVGPAGTGLLVVVVAGLGSEREEAGARGCAGERA